MSLNKEKGITIVALVISVVIILILAGVGVYYGKDAINKAKLEDIRTNMLSIKAKAKIVVEQYNFKDRENLVGTEYANTSNNSIPEELKNIFATLDQSKLYVWTQEDLNSEGLNGIKIDEGYFYIVYYNLDDTNATEIYYSQGYEGKYSLTELKDI